MRVSAKIRFSLLIAVSLLLMALGAGMLVKWSVEKNMLAEARRGSAGSMVLAATNALDFYRANFRIRTDQALQLKRRMQLAGQIITSIADRRMSPEDFLTALPLPEEDSAVIYKEGGVIATRGPFNSDPYKIRDIKGEFVGPAMYRLARDGRPATCVVQLHGGEGEGGRYFGSHFYVAQWDMIFSIWTDIGQFEARQRDFFKLSFEDLKARYDKIHFGDSGFLFVVDGLGQPVIVPGEGGYASSLGYISGLSEHATGIVGVDLLRKAAEHPELTITLDPPWDAVQRFGWIIVHYVKPLDWYVAGVVFMDEISAPGEDLSMGIFSGIAVVGVFIFIATFIFAGRLTAPLAALAAYTRHVPEEDFLAERPVPVLLNRLAASGVDEVARLADSFRFMDGALRERVRELMETTAARERMAGELAAARDIQMDLLPLDLLSKNGNFALWAMLEPAREVGGDLYDFFMTDDEHLWVVIGDVSDKGVPAALFMGGVLALIRSGAAPDISPAGLMGKINNTLARNNQKSMFVTLFIGLLHLGTGEFSYANGGHCRPVLLSGGRASWLLGRSGVFLGVKPDITYTPFSITLAPDDSLFMYTDGVDEAMNAQNEVFGAERLLTTAERLAGLAPRLFGEGVYQAVIAHTGDHPASDDITMLCLNYGHSLEQGSEEDEAITEGAEQ